MGDEGIGPGPPPPPASGEAPTRSDRILLGAFALYAALLLLAAYAQLAEDRALLDLFDLRRWFTR